MMRTKGRLGRPRSGRTGSPRDVITAAIRWDDVSTTVSLAKLPEMRSGLDCDIRAAYILAAISEDRPLTILLEDAINHYTMKQGKRMDQSLGDHVRSVMYGVDAVRRRTGNSGVDAQTLADEYIKSFRENQDVIWRDVLVSQRTGRELENPDKLFRAALSVIAYGLGLSSGKLLLDVLLAYPLQETHPPEHGKTMRDLILYWYDKCVKTRTADSAGRNRSKELIGLLGGYDYAE